MIIDSNQAYNVLMKMNPDQKDLQEALIIYICGLTKHHDRGELGYVEEMVRHIELHEDAIPHLITTLHTKRLLEYDELLDFVRGYSLYIQYLEMAQSIEYRGSNNGN